MDEPPLLPPDSIYTSCWCEENIYLLAQAFLDNPLIANSWETFVVFISNSTKTVALWNQKAAKEEGLPVVWDYHVILVLRYRTSIELEPSKSYFSPSRSWVYDFDSHLPMPYLWEDYLSCTFSKSIPPQYQSLFRIVPAEMYLKYFASDRSHMLRIDEHGNQLTEYNSPPPLYSPLCGSSAAAQGITNNLSSSFVCMRPSDDSDSYGVVVALNMLNGEWPIF